MSARRLIAAMPPMLPLSLTICDRMAEGRLPSRHELRCAHQAARALHSPTTALADAQQSFRALPSSGLVGLDQFETGSTVLADIGLLNRAGETFTVPAELGCLREMSEGPAIRFLLDLLLARRPPGWLPHASAKGVLNSVVIPDRDLATVEAVIPDPELREAVLLEAGRRFDADRLATLGSIGELHVVDLCRAELDAAERPDLAGQVVRVSIIADDLGYDITAPTLTGVSRRLEVKASRCGDVYITRNEFFGGLHDQDWALVVVGIDARDCPELWGWIRAPALQDLVPLDVDDHGHWQSTRLLGIRNRLEPGLPPL
jgi:hypothetical protein